MLVFPNVSHCVGQQLRRHFDTLEKLALPVEVQVHFHYLWGHDFQIDLCYMYYSIDICLWLIFCYDIIDRYATDTDINCHETPHNTIGDFRVTFCLCTKASPSAKPFIWKLVLFTHKFWFIYMWIKLISIWKASHWALFWNRGEKQPRNGLLHHFTLS